MGHAAPVYVAPSFVTEYPDGRIVQTSVAARWNSLGTKNTMPELATTNVADKPQVAPAIDAQKPRKVPAKRAAKAPKKPEGQGDLF
jgi:hypothetical protein